jgi:agmatine deiminase
MPPAIIYDGQRVPASYANFYITNNSVLLPGYDRRTDQQAKSILAEHFPQREIIVIDCRDLIWGLGAFHCLTQQVPAV